MNKLFLRCLHFVFMFENFDLGYIAIINTILKYAAKLTKNRRRRPLCSLLQDLDVARTVTCKIKNMCLMLFDASKRLNSSKSWMKRCCFSNKPTRSDFVPLVGDPSNKSSTSTRRCFLSTKYLGNKILLLNDWNVSFDQH